jgi:D-cysteine desulfhydrase family pyridoxal phosphate-dependent enzyme
MNLDDFPRAALAHLPTPLEPMERLSAELGGPRLWVKRDDCTGLALGGNKTRKLEFLMAEALEAGADSVITAGGVQSNHVRQTAAAAAKLGLAAHLVLTRNVPWDKDGYDRTGNILLDRLLGAEIRILPAGSDRAAAMDALAASLRAAGGRPYVIPLGGSNATGALGYALCARELLAQAEALCGGLDAVVLASSSGGSQAGLIAGLAALDHPARVIGIEVDGDREGVAAAVREVAAAAAQRLGLDAGEVVARVEVVAGYGGPGYGLPTPEMRRAVELAARREGLLLDPVYSGKAMAGLIGLIAEGRFGPDDRVVFLHSGGTPALFAYRSVFEGSGPGT